MASTDWQTTPPLTASLAEKPCDFDFFRALRLLQCAFRDQPPIGCSQVPKDDPIRFAQNPFLTFAPSTLEELRLAPDGKQPPRLYVHCFGLFGPNGPLPTHLTQYARERRRDFGDTALIGFLNLFHHRLISLFFKAWAANQKAVDMDRALAVGSPGESGRLPGQRFGTYIGSLFGLGMESLTHRDSVPDLAKLYFSGWLAHQPRNADGLEAIVQGYFGVPARVQTFVGRWLALPAENRCLLGRTPENATLGRNTIVGARRWECQLNFRLRLGPLTLPDYERLLPRADDQQALPGVSAFEQLKTWVLNYLPNALFWDVQLVLKSGEFPQTRLGRSGRLGWTTWLIAEPFRRAADDLILVTE
jgi:type VI secretion system protein ImpH